MPSTPRVSSIPREAPTVLELGQRSDAPRLAIGTTPPIAVSATASLATPASLAGARIGTPTPSSLDMHATVRGAPVLEPRTINLRMPAYIAPSLEARPRPRAAVGVALLYAVFAILIAPLAPIAWMFAAEQLDLVDRRLRSADGKRMLELAQGIGIAMTMVAVAATAFGLTVLIVR